YKPIPGRFKDYIAMPKPNGYQSLHTTLIGPKGKPFEIQIRTEEMHRIAEYGICAHWKYKAGTQSKEEIDRKLEWIAKLIDTEDDTRDPDEFMQALKIDIFHDETFVFTPKGDVITLPYGSTVIDFAYAIHSQVGNRMVGAKINGMIVPIDRVPHNGEIVEILTSSSSKGPSRDWLKIVKTGEARTKIRQWFKKEKQEENIQVGKYEIEKELRKYNRPFTEEQMEEILSNIIPRIGIVSVDSLYNTIGYGGLSISKISGRLKDEFDRVVKIPEEEKPITVDSIKTGTITHKHKNGGVIIDGIEGCAVKFAKCCNPLPGDELIGFITKGYGVSVHKKDCPNVCNNYGKPEYKDRFVSAKWENEELGKNSSMFEALLVVYARNSFSLLASITAALAEMRVTLLQINTQKAPDDCIIINLTVSCKNLDHVNSIVSRLNSIENIESVKRGFAG
ncbi:MAG: TGS domain-containing protein, partial [Clostridia bacterium]|nr:TGS domain-containing protein [Clostridia bacterium]